MKIAPLVRCLSTSLFAFALIAALRAQADRPAPPPVVIPDYSRQILTPAPAHTPRITGPKVYGQRPGSPFLFTLTATGDRPMTFSAEGLLAGLVLDPATGQITGKVAQAGSFTVKVGARNALGAATRELKIVIGDQIALTPPMGWNSWNSWAGEVDQGKVLRSARVLVSSGLVNHGWTYVNIDDTWQGTRTGPDHALLANEKFSDLKGLCDELHAMGLKAGIYSTPWITSYASFPGGSSDSPEGAWTKAELGNDAAHRIGKYHFTIADAAQLAAWGFDYLKYDWNIDVPTTQEMSDALRKTGRDIVFSLSNTAPFQNAGDWARLSQAWRTTGDITDTWINGNMSWNNGIAKIGFAQDRWTPFSGPGHWNDPDMLVIGVVSVSQPMHFTHLTPDEQYTHLSLWSLLAAPLLIGCDLERVDPFTLSLLTNDEVLDVDQDPLGKPAVRVAGPEFYVPPRPRRGSAADAPPTDPANPPAVTVPADNPGGNGLVYARPLEDGTLAMGLFNVGPREEKVTATWKALGVDGKRVVRDLWRQKDLGVFENEFSATVPAHGVVLVKLNFCPPPMSGQKVELKGDASGRRFDGIGAVSGGGATSVLLKDYPEPQRSQVLDLLFKPKFGASMSAFFVEVPGDGNSTQGSEPSHMHTRDDVNFYRGYEWWLMAEAKKRNPDLSLDGCAWSCPAWVGNGNFWSQDMADYYAAWIKGLKSAHGLDLDAIGCRNEKGVSEDFIKMLHTTLAANGFSKVRVHGFDNWQKDKFDWVAHLATDPQLRAAVGAVGNHTMANTPTPPAARQLLEQLNIPIWNTEEHVYKQGFDCEISLVQAFNENFLRSGVTKIVNWYLVASVYPIEPYPETPALLIARSPWSGNFSVREVLWGYAHYGQFSQIGWQYLNDACGQLGGGGTFVTLKSPGSDYSVIVETKAATAVQNVTFKLSGGLSPGKLCVWRSNATAQFVRQADITPVDGTFTVALAPSSIYSISTTTGQQKGTFADIPAAKDFPFPYYENFESYAQPAQWGWLPHYTADIDGVFEIADRPDQTGKCLRQVIGQHAQSWAPEWMPYTILGDEKWKDYEVSADVYLDNGGWAGVMGRVNHTGTGYGCVPKGYYLRLAVDGSCALFAATQERNADAGKQLATGQAANVAGRQWHNVKLQFSGTTITGFVDGVQVLTATDSLYSSGMAGLITGEVRERNTALFDNLLINAVGAAAPKPTVFAPTQTPIYKL